MNVCSIHNHHDELKYSVTFSFLPNCTFTSLEDNVWASISSGTQQPSTEILCSHSLTNLTCHPTIWEWMHSSIVLALALPLLLMASKINNTRNAEWTENWAYEHTKDSLEHTACKKSLYAFGRRDGARHTHHIIVSTSLPVASSFSYEMIRILTHSRLTN